VNRFSEKAAAVIEKEPYRGRVDQIWGNGLLAVFGEYMDIQKLSPELACLRAVAAAADLIEESEKVFKEWMQNDFDYEHFLSHNNEHISLRPVVAVDYGNVVFDYIGSAENRVYMSVGDHVNFVKQLASTPIPGELSDNTYHLMRHLLSIFARATPDIIEQLDEPPIILSQAAYTGSKDILKPLPHMPPISLQHARKIHLPGKTTTYPVYEIWPQNVERTKIR
jgi:class 3 adenylate cyclase